MRRKDRQVTEKEQLQKIMDRCDVCRLGLYDGQEVYILPLNFGYSWQGGLPELFFHGAAQGRKLDILAQNPRVGFEMDCSHKLITGSAPCNWTMEFESIIGQGVVEVVQDRDQRIRGLDLLMAKYGYKGGQGYHQPALEHTAILRLAVTQLSGKRLQTKQSD